MHHANKNYRSIKYIYTKRAFDIELQKEKLLLQPRHPTKRLILHRE